jgi:hypothetical protein
MKVYVIVSSCHANEKMRKPRSGFRSVALGTHKLCEALMDDRRNTNKEFVIDESKIPEDAGNQSARSAKE